MALPALEYCNLTRASRLLGCEIDDLIHWWLIGTIELHICLDGKKSILVGQNKSDKPLPIAEAFEKMFKEMGDITSSKLSKLYKMKSFDYSRYPSNRCYHCIAYGLWKVLPSSVTRELKERKIRLISEYHFKNSERKEGVALLSHDVDNFYLIFDEIDTEEGLEINVEDLIITKRHIDRLNPEINKNSLNLPNWIKQDEFDDKPNNTDEKTIPLTIMTEKQERIQNPERILWQIYLKEHFTLLWNNSNSTTLTNELNFLASKHGFGEKTFNEKTVSGWISRYSLNKR